MTTIVSSSKKSLPSSSGHGRDEDCRLRLLLHTVDGIIPFLTPHLLRKCFPPSSPHYFWVGFAVRDTCVVPIYRDKRQQGSDKNGGSDKQVERSKINDGNGVEKTTAKNNNKKSADNKNGHQDTGDSRKPRGYTFQAAEIDSWMRGYPRVMVPSFDLVDDVVARCKTVNQQEITVTNQHVLIWTPNGRIPLTPQMYREAIKKSLKLAEDQNACSSKNEISDVNIASTVSQSKCCAVVPLYDMIQPSSSFSPEPNNQVSDVLRKAQHKRKATAIRHNKEWLSHFLQQTSNNNEIQKKEDEAVEARESTTGELSSVRTNVWAPIVVTNVDNGIAIDRQNTDEKDEDGVFLTQQLESIEKMVGGKGVENNTSTSNNEKCVVDGVVLIGWQYLEQSAVRRSLLKQIADRVKASPHVSTSPGQTSLQLCVLSVKSLLQFLDAAVSGCNVVGTSLPTSWTLAKKAFICRLSGWDQPQDKNLNDRDACTSPKKKARTNTDDTPSLESVTSLPLEDGCIPLVASKKVLDDGDFDVSSHPWYRDPSPILSSCTCSTCKTHSRAYVYHLVCAEELLAEILLFIHNFHQMIELVKEMNKALEQGEEMKLYRFIESQLNKK